MNLSIFKPKTPAVASAPAETPKPAGESLEDVLLELTKWGTPRVQSFDDGTWYCCVNVKVTPVGVTFEAKSDFKQKTPLDAAIQCRENLRAAVKAIGGAA